VAVSARPRHLQWRAWLIVAAGGAVGAAAREALSLSIPPVGGVPVTIALINICGAFLLGYLYEALTRRPAGDSTGRNLRLLLGTGFCGGFTTYSSLATDAAVLAHHGHHWLAVLYTVGTVLLGAAATWAGIVTASRANERASRAGAGL
jgi:fluoride exporter